MVMVWFFWGGGFRQPEKGGGMQMGFGVRMGLSGVELRFRLLLNIAIFLPEQAFRRLPRAGEGLFIFGL